MRKHNIVIFSSGVSEKNGLLGYVKQGLEAQGCSCYCWRDLFAGSNHPDSIALLPMLVKKIPTFDFALLICEGHDKTVLHRDGKEQVQEAMRDNVLFEIGLCTVALGLSRVMLLADDSVRMPEDLIGLNGQLALKRIPLVREGDTYGSQMIADIIAHVADNCSAFSPVVVGASAATATGYVTNFIFRTLEQVYDGFDDVQTGEHIVPVRGKLKMEICIPYSFSSETSVLVRDKQKALRRGVIASARRRQLEFNYIVLEDGTLVIRDYPTTLVTSYSTAKTILNLPADDGTDISSEQRFVAKELDYFEAALCSLLRPAFVERHIAHYFGELSEEARQRMCERLVSSIEQDVTVKREDLGGM